MDWNLIIGILIIILAIGLIIQAPILKPWFGFRKPKDKNYTGKWFE